MFNQVRVVLAVNTFPYTAYQCLILYLMQRIHGGNIHSIFDDSPCDFNLKRARFSCSAFDIGSTCSHSCKCLHSMGGPMQALPLSNSFSRS